MKKVLKKIWRRPTVHAHRENVRRAFGLARGRSAALKSRGYIQRKTRVFKDVCSMNIHRRLKKLQRLIPGGSTMQEVDVLFKETADYIVSLKMQVCLLRAMSNFCTSNTYRSPWSINGLKTHRSILWLSLYKDLDEENGELYGNKLIFHCFLSFHFGFKCNLLCWN